METPREVNTEGLAVVHVLATVLDRLCVANVAMAQADPGQVTKFHAMKAPGIGILQYLERIHKYASCSSECFILALIYVDRLIQRNNFLLTELNVHRVVITAILLAAKFFDDAYYNNAYYAKVGGVLVSEMNGLEVDFLFRINFSLHVTPEVFEKYRAELLSQAASCAVVPQIPAPVQTMPCTPTSITPSPPSEPVVSPAVVYSPQNLVCNPQAPNFTAATLEQQKSMETDAMDIPYGTSQSCSQIKPSSGPSQMTYVPQPAGKGPVCASDGSTFPMHFSDAFTQVQSSQSCPTTDGGIYSHCGVTTAPTTTEAPSSAPVIITPGMGMHYPMAANHHAAATMAAMLEHQLFPIQNALVHHNHQQGYPIQPNPDSRGAMLAAAAGAQ